MVAQGLLRRVKDGAHVVAATAGISPMNEPERRTLEHRLARLARLECAVRRLQWLVGGAVGVLLLAVAFWIWVRTAPRNEARDRYECYREVKMLGYSPW